MKYRATVITPNGKYSNVFDTMFQAAQWLDSQNNNSENTTMIETFDENGNKKDGFFYTERIK